MPSSPLRALLKLPPPPSSGWVSSCVPCPAGATCLGGPPGSAYAYVSDGVEYIMSASVTQKSTGACSRNTTLQAQLQQRLLQADMVAQPGVQAGSVRVVPDPTAMSCQPGLVTYSFIIFYQGALEAAAPMVQASTAGCTQACGFACTTCAFASFATIKCLRMASIGSSSCKSLQQSNPRASTTCTLALGGLGGLCTSTSKGIQQKQV
jgi:hypothetical protein